MRATATGRKLLVVKDRYGSEVDTHHGLPSTQSCLSLRAARRKNKTQRNFIPTDILCRLVETMQRMKANAHLCFRYATSIEQRQILKLESSHHCLQ